MVSPSLPGRALSVRVRASSRALNMAEERSLVAELVRKLSATAAGSNEVITTLTKLHMELEAHAPSRDTFRRAAGFETCLAHLDAETTVKAISDIESGQLTFPVSRNVISLLIHHCACSRACCVMISNR